MSEENPKTESSWDKLMREWDESLRAWNANLDQCNRLITITLALLVYIVCPLAIICLCLAVWKVWLSWTT